MAMVLPKFENPNPTVEYLRQEQTRLKTQADKMMEQTRIMDVFAKHGGLLGIGGSYMYNLMVYPDLDIEFNAYKVDKNAFIALLTDLANHDAVRGINCVDGVHFPSKTPGRPKGYWIGVDIPFADDRWGIDCWLQESSGENYFNNDKYTARLINLNQEVIDAILSIKYQLIYKGLYGKKYLSVNVYDAVLEGGVRTVEQFLDKMESN